MRTASLVCIINSKKSIEELCRMDELLMMCISLFMRHALQVRCSDGRSERLCTCASEIEIGSVAKRVVKTSSTVEGVGCVSHDSVAADEIRGFYSPIKLPWPCNCQKCNTIMVERNQGLIQPAR